MTRRQVFVVVLILVIAAPAALGADWVTYTHPEHGFTIQYPSGWSRLSGDKNPLLILAGRATPASVPLTLNILGGPLNPGETVDDYRDIIARVLPAQLQGYQALRTDRGAIKGVPIVIHYLTWYQGGVRMYGMQAAVAVKGYGYIITGATVADSPRLREEIDLLQRIILTFRPRG